MEEYKLDFDNSLVVACMKNCGTKKLATFDKHFKKVKEVEIMQFVDE